MIIGGTTADPSVVIAKKSRILWLNQIPNVMPTDIPMENSIILSVIIVRII